MYTDSHCHITCDELWENVDEVLSRMDQIERCMIMCTNEKEFKRALALKARYPGRFQIAFGWYPGDVAQVDEGRLAFLEASLDQLDVLGEIGLDYHWGSQDKEAQKALFIRQLQMAEKAGLPVSIHLRDAMGDGLAILREHARTPIIFHCWSGSVESMQQALKLDSLISFAGPVTYKNNKHGVACVKACPADRLLTETDSPYLSPVPVRGRRNEPCNVMFTTKKICELKELDEAVLCPQIRKNYDSLFDR